MDDPGAAASVERRGKAVFLPFVLAGEKVEGTIVEEKTGFARARTDRILEASPQRIEPGCRYYAGCGGCHYQHTSYEGQLEIKSQILRETLWRTAKLEMEPVQVHASPPWNYRNRTRLHVRATPEFALGYNRFASHELMAVEQCPISSPLINRAIAAVWQLGRAGRVTPELSEIEFFANHDESQLLVELSCGQIWWQSRQQPSLPAFVSELRAAIPETVGIAVFSGPPGKPQTMDEIPPYLEESFGAQEMQYEVAGARYTVGAGSFFQTNRFLAGKLVSLVTAGRDGGFALDLYAGVGLFALPLSQTFREVAAVEIAPFSFHDLQRNVPTNVSSYRKGAELFLVSVIKDAQFDYVVVDPPRGGLGEEVARLLGKLGAPELTYVSCDPATLARDLRELVRAGYRVRQMHLVDLFPQTFHIETVTELMR